MSGNMDQYYKHVGKFNLLTKQQEQDLAKKASEGCTRSRHLLIESNLRLALSIANKYRKTRCNMEELIQEANVGLCKAVDKFDYQKGFRFSTYATWWIKQAILRYISRQSHVKFASGARKKIYDINIARRNYFEEFGVYPDDKEVSHLLGLSLEQVSNLRAANQWPVNLNAPMKGQEGRTYADVIPDNDAEDQDVRIDHDMILEAIKEKLSELKPLEERVLRLRFGITQDKNNQKKFPITQSKGV